MNKVVILLKGRKNKYMWEFAATNTKEFIIIVAIVMFGLTLIAASLAEAFTSKK